MSSDGLYVGGPTSVEQSLSDTISSSVSTVVSSDGTPFSGNKFNASSLTCISEYCGLLLTVPSSGNYTFFSSAFRASFENVRARNATRCVARRSIENSRSINTYSRSNNLRVIALLSQYRIYTLVRYHGNK